MNKSARWQRGAGMLSVMFWLVVGVAVLTLAVRLGPSYMQFMTVRSVMNDMSKDPELQGKGRTQVLNSLSSRLDVNAVEGLPQDAVTMEQDGVTRELVADYEVRTPVVANVDAVVSFNYRVTLPNQ
jgi:hypothetical protein